MASAMLKAAFTTLSLAMFVQMAYCQTQPGNMPERHTEIHTRAGGTRPPIIGMDANEKAGLTVGFTVTWFMFILMGMMVAKMHFRVTRLEEYIEGLKVQKMSHDLEADDSAKA